MPSFTKDFAEKQIPLDPAASELSEVSLDAKELIRAFTNESKGEESSIDFDSLAGVDPHYKQDFGLTPRLCWTPRNLNP